MPQEKKALSCAEDCRDDSGENDKASRKNLPRKWARVHRDLLAANERADVDLAEDAEDRFRGKRQPKFRKRPYIGLAEYVAFQWQRRAQP